MGRYQHRSNGRKVKCTCLRFCGSQTTVGKESGFVVAILGVVLLQHSVTTSGLRTVNFTQLDFLNVFIEPL